MKYVQSRLKSLHTDGSVTFYVGSLEGLKIKATGTAVSEELCCSYFSDTVDGTYAQTLGYIDSVFLCLGIVFPLPASVNLLHPPPHNQMQYTSPSHGEPMTSSWSFFCFICVGFAVWACV